MSTQVDTTPSITSKEQEEIDRLLRLAICFHVYRKNNLVLVTLENYKHQRVYLTLSENQSLYWMPTGAGGTRWPKYIKVSDRDWWIDQCCVLGDKQNWRVVNIEPLHL